MNAPPTESYLSDVVADGHQRGWSYTPLDGKKPRESGWQKAPRESLEQALGWCVAGGTSNVGLRTGQASGGIVVIDVDSVKGGRLESLPPMPPTVRVITGGGGLHLYFQNTSGERVGNRAGITDHVDVRGDGGQVVAPGSTHPDTGVVYEYAPGFAPWEIDVAVLPEALLRLINPPKPATAPAAPRAARPAGQDRYAAAAFDREVKSVQNAKEGTRNHTLNKAAFSLGQFVGAGRLTRAEVEAALLGATVLPRDEAAATIRSGLDAGVQSPRPQEEPKPRVKRPPPQGGPAVAAGPAGHYPPPGAAAAVGAAASPFVAPAAAQHPAPPTPPPSSGPPPMSPFAPSMAGAAAPQAADAARLLSDLGNSERLIKRHGENIRFVTGVNRWHVWDGRRWAPDEANKIVGFAKETALSIFNEAAGSTYMGEQKELSKHALAAQSRDRLSAMVYLAQDRRAVHPSALNTDPWALNCNNGTVDLRTGVLRPHDRADLITHVCPVDYEPAAGCPRWEAFMAEVLPDPAVRVFVQRWLGHSGTGDVREQYLPFFWGDGNNGKSVLLDTVSAVYGSYASEAPPDLLTAGAGGGDHPTDIADLLGRRFVVASETEAYAKLRVQLVKRLTGNARLKGRYMRQDFFEFDRTHKLVLATNGKPQITETTEAIWRRVRLVHFSVVIPGPRVDKSLMHKLRAEHKGILAWLVRGAVDWLREGLTEPAAIVSATRAYREASDAFAEFSAECLRLEDGAFAASEDVRKAYEAHCKAVGAEPMTPSALRDKLKTWGATPGKSNTRRGWAGLRVI